MQLANNRVRGFLRLVAVVGIVLFCGATTCTRPVGDIMYAPGYGYIVKVKRQAGMIDSTLSKNYYYIFPTEQRAAEFYHEYYLNPDGFQRTLREGERGVHDDGDRREYDKITKLLQPLPPPMNETEIPLVVPDLPQPIPQGPL